MEEGKELFDVKGIGLAKPQVSLNLLGTTLLYNDLLVVGQNVSGLLCCN